MHIESYNELDDSKAHLPHLIADKGTVPTRLNSKLEDENEEKWQVSANFSSEMAVSPAKTF